MLFEKLNEVVDTEKAAIEFALKWNLLPEKHVICPVCSIGNVGWYKRSHEGLKIPYALRCSRKKCRKKWSVTKNTWFFGSHLSVRQNILLIYCWVNGDTVGETSETLKLSKSTVMDYYQFCREVCYTVVSNRSKPIGGFGEIVSLCDFQVDRLIDKEPKTINFLEGINTRTNDCFLIEVHCREAAILIYLLKMFILPGTTLLIDDFTDYSKIADQQVSFEGLNIKFVTNSDSSLVSVSKKCSWKIKKKIIEDEESKSKNFIIFQYLYFHPIEMLSTGEKFEKFLNDVAKVYPGPFKVSMVPVIY